jgi:hypothetical protein
MTKLTASQDVSQFLASANKTEAVNVLGGIKTENLLGSTLIIQADDTVKAYLGDIGYSQFIGQSTLKGLSLGSSVTTIGNYAFEFCSNFAGSLTIPNSVTTIGDYAFEFCSNFAGSLTIGNSVTTIGQGAFSNCSNITRININRATAPAISSYAFYGMTAVSPAVIHVPSGASGYAETYNGLTVVYDL